MPAPTTSRCQGHKTSTVQHQKLLIQIMVFYASSQMVLTGSRYRRVSMDEAQRYETVTLYGLGALPGIPGEHGAGTYVIDWQERTIRLAGIGAGEEIPPLETPVEPVATPQQEEPVAERPPREVR